MSEFSMGFTLDGVSYTLNGKAGERQWVSRVAGPCEPNEYSVQWKVRIVDETHKRVCIVRPILSGTSPSGLAAVRALEYITLDRGLVWNDLIEANDPRLQ
jgi:hypothetical protein